MLFPPVEHEVACQLPRDLSSALLFAIFLPPARGMASIFVEHSNHGNSFQQVCAVRSLIKTGGQIHTSSMQHLMLAILPQETARYIIYLTLVGYEGRYPILAIVLGKFLPRKPSHIQNAFGSYSREIRGRPCENQGLPFTESDLTSETWIRRERSHHGALNDRTALPPGTRRTTIRARLPH